MIDSYRSKEFYSFPILRKYVAKGYVIWCDAKMLNSWQGEDFGVKIMYSKAGVATQILISTSECDLLVDAGDGVLRDLLEVDYRFERLQAIAVTHGHFDHVGGLWTLLGFLYMIGRTSDLLLITPRSCREVRNIVEGFLDIYAEKMPFQIIVKELSNREKIDIKGMMVQAFSVIHRGLTEVYGVGKRVPAFGYSISYKEQRIVISGDTGMCRSLTRFARGADLAILEATVKERAAKYSQVHLSVEEATKIGKTAKKFILIHQ